MGVVLFFMNVYQQACIHLLNFANKIDSIYLILLEKQPALKWFNHLSVSKIQGGSLIRIVQLLQLKFKKKKKSLMEMLHSVIPMSFAAFIFVSQAV